MSSGRDDRLTMIGVYHLRRPIRFPASLSQGSFREATRQVQNYREHAVAAPERFLAISEFSTIPRMWMGRAAFGGGLNVRG